MSMFREPKENELDELMSPHGKTTCSICESADVFWVGMRDVWPFMCKTCEEEYLKTYDRKVEIIEEREKIEEAKEKPFVPRYGIQSKDDDHYSNVAGIPVLDMCLTVSFHQRYVWEARAFYDHVEPVVLGTYFDKSPADKRAEWQANREKDRSSTSKWTKCETRGWIEKVITLPNGESYRIGPRIDRSFDHERAEITQALEKLTPRELRLLRNNKWLNVQMRSSLIIARRP